MTHFTSLITFGVLTAFLPLSGFPYSWERVGVIILGILTALVAWHGKRAYQRRHAPRRAETFEENESTSTSHTSSNDEHDAPRDPINS